MPDLADPTMPLSASSLGPSPDGDADLAPPLQAAAPARSHRSLAALLATLQRWPWIDTLRTLRERFREDRLGQTAGSLTFTTLIALVPLVTVMLAVFSAFPYFASFKGALEQFFLQNLIPDTIAKPVLNTLTGFAAKANRVGTAGLLVLVWTALALVLTIDRTLNGIWRVRRPRPLASRILVYWAALTLGPLLLGASLTLTSYALSASKGLVAALPGALSFAIDVVQFLLMAAATAGLFRYVPNTRVELAHAVAGGLFVAVAFELAKKLLGWYLVLVPTYGSVYGAFATVPILLLWTYLVWVIVLLGAVIAAYAPTLRMGLVRRASAPGWRFAFALRVLERLQAVRVQPQQGLSVMDLASALHADPLQVEPLLEVLVRLGWVGRLDEEGAQRHVLLVDPSRTAAGPLVDQLLLAPDDTVEPFRTLAGLGRMRLSDLLARAP